jgi:hypothetical protein
MPYSQFLIDSPIATNFSHQQQRNDANNEQLALGLYYLSITFFRFLDSGNFHDER